MINRSHLGPHFHRDGVVLENLLRHTKTHAFALHDEMPKGVRCSVDDMRAYPLQSWVGSRRIGPTRSPIKLVERIESIPQFPSEAANRCRLLLTELVSERVPSRDGAKGECEGRRRRVRDCPPHIVKNLVIGEHLRGALLGIDVLGVSAQLPRCPGKIEGEKKLGRVVRRVVEVCTPLLGQALTKVWRSPTHCQSNEGGERLTQVHTIPPIIGWRTRSSCFARFAPRAVSR
jgi:hypothetical protein